MSSTCSSATSVDDELLTQLRELHANLVHVSLELRELNANFLDIALVQHWGIKSNSHSSQGQR